jgi:hypothetical protein
MVQPIFAPLLVRIEQTRRPRVHVRARANQQQEQRQKALKVEERRLCERPWKDFTDPKIGANCKREKETLNLTTEKTNSNEWLTFGIQLTERTMTSVDWI